MPIAALEAGVKHGDRFAVAAPGHIDAAAVAMHHQGGRQPQLACSGLGQAGQGRLQGQLALATDGGRDQALGNGAHLDHQATGPLLHQVAHLGGVTLMQVDRQAEAELEGGRQGQIGRPAPIDHQGIAHGGGRAVQI